MPTLTQIREEVSPVVLREAAAEGAEPLIGYCRRNAATRANRVRLQEIIDGAGQALAKTTREAAKMQAQALDRAPAIAAKSDEIAEAENADQPDAARIAELRAELEKLEAEQEANAKKVEGFGSKLEKLLEEAEDASHRAVAQQLAHFIARTNVTVSDEDDTPVEASEEFFFNEFDLSSASASASRRRCRRLLFTPGWGSLARGSCGLPMLPSRKPCSTPARASGASWVSRRPELP